ncbi:hypothetical protein GQ457_11G029810 [Hibiscus cannabinus]
MASNSLGVNISQPTIPVFQSNNYSVWSTKMKTLFISQDLWELVEKGYSEEGVAVEALRDYKKKDAKALFLIQQAVDDAIFSSRISAATKAKEAWDALKNGYQGTTRITDQKVVEKLLRSLTRKYESTISAIEKSKDLTFLTIDELLGSLQSHEDRHKSYEENATEKAFQAKLKFPKENTTGHERSGNYIRGGYFYRGRRSGRGGGQSSDRQQHSADGSQTPHPSLEDDSWLWHHRCIDAVCESCVVGKQHRDPFSKSSNVRASKPAELIHVDVCGPMQTLSLNNNMYFVVFVDDFSRMTWVYFVKDKSEVFSVFKKLILQLKSKVEMQ